MTCYRDVAGYRAAIEYAQRPSYSGELGIQNRTRVYRIHPRSMKSETKANTAAMMSMLLTNNGMSKPVEKARANNA